ncbi:MAG: aspartate/glutamate racemase family protein, partial [Achromobacter kerstersii]|uniref:aspartate/glutamate racemase family protein n=1 Tax=Achromobacter kerstersii TaxID=1353890 RepID=UPI003D042260
MKTFSQGCYLGVLGGMGPMAGAAFALRLAALTPAAIDQQHIPTLLRNDPRIPDRSSAYMAGGENPLPYMVGGVRFLEQAGAQLIAIPCNTAHLWYDEIAASTGLPVLHIIEAVIDDLRRLGLPRGRIGLMGTAATLKLGLYQQ